MAEIKKINLLLMSASPNSKGGIANWVRIIRDYTAERDDISIRYLYPADAGPNGKPAIERTRTERVFGGIRLMMQAQKQLRQQIKQERPDVIHITTSGSLAISRDILYLWTAKRHHIPTVYHIRFGRVREIYEKKTPEWFFMKRALKKATQIVAIDRTTEEALKKALPKKNILCIPNPFDASAIGVPPDCRQQENCTITFVGWVVKTKGVEELLTAWQKLSEAYPDARLKIVGPLTDEYRAALEQKFSLSKVEITGPVEHPEALRAIGECDIFTLPSYTEGFPNVVLEAMAYAKPIVATTVGAIPEMLADDCGLLTAPQSAEELEHALEKLLSDSALRKKLGDNARRKLLQEYDLPNVFAAYLRLWNGLRDEAKQQKK